MLTEFEKTILLSLFILAKGSSNRYIPLEMLLSKFPIRQRRMVKGLVESMTKQKFLIKQGQKYKTSKTALKEISTFLIQGPKARI